MGAEAAPAPSLAGRAAGQAALILASASPARAALLAQAGVPCATEPAAIDEEEVKAALRAAGADAAKVAETLAELKAQRVSSRHPGAVVIGADQVLECGGVWFDKPADSSHARNDLLALRGKSHDLVTCVCVVRDGQRLWHHTSRATLHMREFSGTFLESYLTAVGAEALESVGAYQLEGLGAQLFARIDGDYFSILGLPLLPLLDFLRGHGMVMP